MAKFHRKKSAQRFDVTLDGEMFGVTLGKLNITEILTLERSGSQVMAQIADAGGKLSPEAHTELVETVCALIVEVDSLTDEEGKPLSWAELGADQRHDLIASIEVDSLTELFKVAGSVGRLKSDEKKDSSPTL